MNVNPQAQIASETQPVNASNSGCLIFSMLAIIAGVIIYLLWHWSAILRTILLSFQRYDIMRPAQFVGGTNFSNLFSDQLFWSSLGQTGLLAVARVIAVSAIWLILLFSWSQRHRINHLFVLLALFALPFAAPVSSWSVWQYHVTSPDAFLNPLLGGLSNQRSSFFIYDFLQTMAFAAAIGLGIYTLADSGRRAGRSGNILSTAWLIGCLLALASAIQLPMLHIESGSDEFINLARYSYESAFYRFRLGYSSAVNIFMILPLLLLAIVSWFIVMRTPITLRSISGSEAPQNDQSTLGIGLFLLALVPLFVILVPKAFTFLAVDNAQLSTSMPVLQWVMNSLLVYIPSIWMIQLPLSLGVGMSIAWRYASGRKRSYWWLFPFAISAVIGFAPVAIPLFELMRNLRLINTLFSIMFTNINGGISLCLIALLMVGLFQDYQRSHDGKLNDNAISRSGVIMRMFLLIFIIGIGATIFVFDQLMMPMIFLGSADSFTLTLGQFSMIRREPNLAHVVTQSELILDLVFAIGLTVFSFFLLRMVALVQTADSTN